MKYKFCSIRICVTEYDVTFATKGEITLNSLLPPPWLRHCLYTINAVPKSAIREEAKGAEAPPLAKSKIRKKIKKNRTV